MNIREYLEQNIDKEYLKFQSSLNVSNMLGVRSPKLLEIAKYAIKDNSYIDFINEKHKYHEENIIHMYILSLIKDKEFVHKELDRIVPKIDNWAFCDSLNKLKIIDKNREYFYDLIEKYKKSNKEFEIRFVIIMLLSHYVCDNYIDDILKIIEEVNNSYYYTKMAIAWLLCELMIKYRTKLLNYLKESNLDDFTINKGIQKMRESFRVSDSDKEYLLKFKR